MVDGRNAAALVVALVDLVRAREADLVDVDTEDLRELESELAAVLRDRLEPGVRAVCVPRRDPPLG